MFPDGSILFFILFLHQRAPLQQIPNFYSELHLFYFLYFARNTESKPIQNRSRSQEKIFLQLQLSCSMWVRITVLLRCKNPFGGRNSNFFPRMFMIKRTSVRKHLPFVYTSNKKVLLSAHSNHFAPIYFNLIHLQRFRENTNYVPSDTHTS